MRITSIELAGSSRTTLRDGCAGLPRAFAKISRTDGDEFITVELLTHAGERTHQVAADDPDDIWSMAEILQHALDGQKGTNSDIDDFCRAPQMLAD